MFPLHQIAHVGVSQSRGLRLFGREVILKEFQPMSSRYLIVTDRRTDRQTKAISIPRYAIVHREVKIRCVVGLVANNIAMKSLLVRILSGTIWRSAHHSPESTVATCMHDAQDTENAHDTCSVVHVYHVRYTVDKLTLTDHIKSGYYTTITHVYV